MYVYEYGHVCSDSFIGTGSLAAGVTGSCEQSGVDPVTLGSPGRVTCALNSPTCQLVLVHECSVLDICQVFILFFEVLEFEEDVHGDCVTSWSIGSPLVRKLHVSPQGVSGTGDSRFPCQPHVPR